MDPTPLSGLLLLLFASQTPLWLLTSFVFLGFGAPSLRRLMRSAKELPEIERGIATTRLERLRWIMLGFGVFLSLGLYLIGRVGFSAANRSVAIWRVFHTNLARCAPYLTDREEEMLRARFRSMNNRADYNVVNDELRRLADKQNIHLESADDI
jgi:hypothetical protein